ncbi:MAG TPA: hypothetical protein VFZ00_18345 [Solirubrobacter sp.]|nr:hypothetical protein [Solirubrobacter sp.]
MGALDTLGWFQFERLCELVLEAETGIEPTRWEGSADQRRWVMIEEPITLAGRTLSPPVLVRCVWRRGEEPELDNDGAASTVTFTNRDGADGDVVLGEAELLDVIRSSPELRLRMPSLLSLDATPLDPGGSTLDLDAARDLARVFVPTPAWHRAVAILREHHFLVLTGPPEMGKTAIARMLGLARLAEGWEVHECIRPEQVADRFKRDRPQLFIADDAFGSTEYRPDAADHWANHLDRIIRATDAFHWLVWTSRPAPLRAGLRRLHRERGGERFPEPASVQVDAGSLGPEEKTLILFRHARAADLPEEQRNLIRNYGSTIVAHPHFTPERIRRFVARGLPDGDIETAIEAQLAEPTEAMSASYRALEHEHRELLLAMLDSPPGPVAERDLAEALRRHASSGLPKAPVDLVDRLADHFLKVLA